MEWLLHESTDESFRVSSPPCNTWSRYSTAYYSVESRTTRMSFLFYLEIKRTQPLLFPDQISSCTNLFPLEPNPTQTTHTDPRSTPRTTHAADRRGGRRCRWSSGERRRELQRTPGPPDVRHDRCDRELKLVWWTAWRHSVADWPSIPDHSGGKWPSLR